MIQPLTPHRRPGRPRKPESERFESRNIKLPPDELDVICRIAIHRRMAIHAVLREAVRLFIAHEHCSGG